MTDYTDKKAANSLIPQDKNKLAAKSKNLVSRGLELVQSSKETVLNFPEDRSLGYIDIRKSDGKLDKVEARSRVILKKDEYIERVSLMPKEFDNDITRAMTLTFGLIYDDNMNVMHSIDVIDLNPSDLQFFNYLDKTREIEIACCNFVSERSATNELSIELSDLDTLNIQRVRLIPELSLNLHKPRVYYDNKDYTLPVFTNDIIAKIITNAPRLSCLDLYKVIGHTNILFDIKHDNLYAMDFTKVEVPQDFFAKLDNFPSLVVLYLADCELTNQHLEKLRINNSVEVLSLNNNHITDEGLKYLTHFKNIKDFSISEDSISGDALLDLPFLSQLTDLYLAGIKLTKNNIEYLATNTNIKRLHLSSAELPITDEFIDSLAKFESLEMVYIYGDLSEEGEKELRELLPNCDIDYDHMY